MPKPILPYDPAKIALIRSWVKDCATWIEARTLIAQKLGVAPDNVTRMHRKHRFWEGGGKATVGKVVGNGVTDVKVEGARTLDEAVSLCNIDLAKWEPKGFSVRSGTSGMGWNARFALKKDVLDFAAMEATFAKIAAQHAPTKWVTEKRSKGEARDCCLILNVHDLHLAKLAWSPETGGAPWDIKIADETYRATIDELIAKAPADRVEKVVMIIGSDMLQVDNDESSTTAGTYVDSDSRLAKAFQVAAKMVTDIVTKLAVRFDVEVVVIPGNHDHSTSFFLGQFVWGWFREHKRVIVHAAPKSRKYIGYGKTLIGFDHGDETKGKDLPLLVMRENQDTISQYRFTEVLTGHLHSEQSDDYKGVIVRVCPALCSADKWHFSKGFVGAIRRAQALLYQRDNGLEAIYYSTPLD